MTLLAIALLYFTLLYVTLPYFTLLYSTLPLPLLYITLLDSTLGNTRAATPHAQSQTSLRHTLLPADAKQVGPSVSPLHDMSTESAANVIHEHGLLLLLLVTYIQMKMYEILAMTMKFMRTFDTCLLNGDETRSSQSERGRQVKSNKRD